jgi:uncharacterized membrane protein
MDKLINALLYKEVPAPIVGLLCAIIISFYFTCWGINAKLMLILILVDLGFSFIKGAIEQEKQSRADQVKKLAHNIHENQIKFLNEEIIKLRKGLEQKNQELNNIKIIRPELY